MRIKKNVMIIISLSIITMIWCLIYYEYSFFPVQKGYNRAVYTIVLYNNTNTVQNNIKISYGDNFEKSIEYADVNSIEQKEYRKINIPTDDPQIDPPWNVYISSVGKDNKICPGYFGLKTGGFEFIEINGEDDNIKFKIELTDSLRYKIVYHRHRKNQNETSWY